MIQWLRLHAPNAGGVALIPGQGNRVFPGGLVVKNLTVNAGDIGSIFGSGRSPGVGNGNSFQYSCLENPMDREACWLTVHWVAKSCTLLNTHTQTSFLPEQEVDGRFREEVKYRGNG